MINGIGTDILELDKIRQYSDKKYFLDKVFTKKEIDYAKNNIAHLATTFAAKEAIFKALGKGWLEPKEIEIIRNKNGKPRAIFSGSLKKMLKNKEIMINLSYSKNYAVAFAVVQDK
jgi:holo-[acyl-carrier protein] synthase